ncbi:MAG: hypothetical protein Q9220_006683 [cf. Caloplaca sp. 1 TL-2023]
MAPIQTRQTCHEYKVVKSIGKCILIHWPIQIRVDCDSRAAFTIGLLSAKMSLHRSQSSHKALTALQLVNIGWPILTIVIYHSDHHCPGAAGTLLSNPLTMPAVSHATKSWVDAHKPEMLKELHVTCPLPPHVLQANSEFRRLAPECSSLTIELLPSTNPIPKGDKLNFTPAGQIFNIVNQFSTLHVVAPSVNGFYPLLSLRLALESSGLKSLTHIHIEPIDIPGLLALRWGAFDALAESTWLAASFWRSIKSLRIGITTSWLDYAHPDLTSEQDVESIARKVEERRIYRQSIQVLHDYLFHFSLNGALETLHFEWLHGCGPNPLLLDEEMMKGDGEEWFSAPGLTWKGLKEVWLGNVRMDTASLKILKDRLGGLATVMVWEDMAEVGIRGTVHERAGLRWLDVHLTDQSEELADFGKVEDLVDEDKRGRVQSLVVPFVLKLD